MFRYLTCTGDRKQLNTYMTAHICNKNTHNYIGSLDSTNVIAYMDTWTVQHMVSVSDDCIMWVVYIN